jgi:predicted nucleic acid-binding protein
MRSRIVLDTGPLVALLNRRDNYHTWARTSFAEAEPPLLTCEAVLSEACFLVRALPKGPQVVLDLLHNKGWLPSPFASKMRPMPAWCAWPNNTRRVS